MSNINWPDEVRLHMIEKSKFYDDEVVYQYGFFDGYQYAFNEIRELKLMLQQAEDAAGANEQRAREAEQACRDLDKGYLKLGLY